MKYPVPFNRSRSADRLRGAIATRRNVHIPQLQVANPAFTPLPLISNQPIQTLPLHTPEPDTETSFSSSSFSSTTLTSLSSASSSASSLPSSALLFTPSSSTSVNNPFLVTPAELNLREGGSFTSAWEDVERWEKLAADQKILENNNNNNKNELPYTKDTTN